MQQAIPRLNKRIEEVKALDPNAINSLNQASNVTIALAASIEDALVRSFGANTLEYNRFSSAASFSLPFNMYEEPTIFEVREYLTEGKESSIILLQQAVKSLEERLEEAGSTADTTSAPARPTANSDSRKVFLVHGHDAGPRESVARFLERAGFQPIILHEQANQGKTIIEKFEANADVGFAIILLTPDDIGGPKSGDQKPRARQNVILELGYFIGRLGRERVCALKSGDLEIPSDIFGVVWTAFDTAGAWKSEVAKELIAANYTVDWNKVMS